MIPSLYSSEVFTNFARGVAMLTVNVRCYAELNDHLEAARRYVTSDLTLDDGATIETAIAVLLLERSEIDLVLLDGRPSQLNHPLHNQAHLALYPVFESIDIAAAGPAQGSPIRQPRFIVDVHLGKLASHLRMFGFDTVYRTTISDDELILIATNERRAILSKDKALLADSRVLRCCRIKSDDAREQLIEVLRRFDLADCIKPFTRCIDCNVGLRQVKKEAVVERLPSKVREHYEEFRICTTCDRIYWDGSHVERMKEFIGGVLGSIKGHPPGV